MMSPGRHAVSRAKQELAYPMYILPLDAVLAFDRIPTHEDVAAQLLQWEEGMETLFVSHTWLAFRHPDNKDNVKLRLLQEFLLDAGKRDVNTYWTVELTLGNKMRIPKRKLKKIKYVWLDYWSIPQANGHYQAKAIASIPGYVACSSFFACFAGAWTHESGASPSRECQITSAAACSCLVRC